MKIIVFCGPTISTEDASAILKADFRPPAGHGDLISCVYADRPDIIVLIDTEFIDSLSVWHNEINDALNRGVTLYGASAMGAVRAAEMQALGMRGIGEVFKLISDGTIEADDEVLCDYTAVDGVYNKKTVSVVNLRYVLSEAENAGVITGNQSAGILTHAKSMFYKNRVPGSMIAACHQLGILNRNEADSFLEFITLSRSDQQKQDAVECLEAVGALREEDLDRTGKNYQYDLFFEALYERDRGARNGNGYYPFYRIANDFAMYGPDIEAVNDAALNRKICALVADNFNIEASPEEISDERRLFIKRHRLNGENDFPDWLKYNDLTEQDFDALLEERVKINKLQNWYRTRLGFARNTRYLLEELKLNNRYAEWKQKSMDIHDTLKNNGEDTLKAFNEYDIGTLATHFLKRNSRPWSHAPFDFIKKIGMHHHVFKHLLARDKTLSDVVTLGMFEEV
jgi:hypothetical protein